MLTLFTIPKAFHGHTEVIQRNAITSWSLLRPPCQLILCGDDDGTAQAAADVGALHVPVERNSYGTPRLDAAFREARRLANGSILGYLNADIVLPPNFTDVVGRLVGLRRFMLIGRRTELDVPEPLPFTEPDWETSLLRRASEEGRPGHPQSLDFFVFRPAAVADDMPPFAVGRPGWDNWFVHHALRKRVPVVDASEVVTAIHQNHGYEHVPQRRGSRWEGPEADEHNRLIGARRADLRDATHHLTSAGLQARWWPKNVLVQMQRLRRHHPRIAKAIPSWKLLYLLCLGRELWRTPGRLFVHYRTVRQLAPVSRGTGRPS